MLPAENCAMPEMYEFGFQFPYLGVSLCFYIGIFGKGVSILYAFNSLVWEFLFASYECPNKELQQ